MESWDRSAENRYTRQTPHNHMLDNARHKYTSYEQYALGGVNSYHKLLVKISRDL